MIRVAVYLNEKGERNKIPLPSGQINYLADLASSLARLATPS